MATVSQRSPLEDAVSRVGDRWSFLLVEALQEGPRRFTDLQEDVEGIAPNTLSQRLRHLEREGILVARPYSDRPRRAAYELTAEGRELSGALRLLAHWGAQAPGAAEPPRHAVCGTPMEARWFCPTCSVPVGDHEQEALRFL